MSKVTLRKKAISKGRQTLFLDIYPPVPNPKTGKMQRKYYLKIFIYGRPRTELERDHNKETLSLGEHLRAKRQLDVQNRRFDFLSESKLKSNFIDFFKDEAAKRAGSANWRMSVNYFKEFVGEEFPFTHLNETFCEEYADFLLSSPGIGRAKRKIKTNTAVSYFAKFKSTLKEAYKKRFLPVDLGRIVDSITPEDTHREFLFMHELEKLATSPCDLPVVKKAGLFSAMTGFRYSDVETLLWKEIQGAEDNYYILYNQEKTESAEYYPVSNQIIQLLGPPGPADAKVFDGLKYDHVVKELKKWLINAGIEKHFTFHGFRHTFATLQLASGTSIYTVSKLLGHKNIKTTEIYTKIVDSLKKEASEKIKLSIFNIGEKLISAPSVMDDNDSQIHPCSANSVR
ncbi:site-specific integrase [Pedobacter alluvionis]|uniref:Phage integrase family protein n=1 Tax=Pedobacter alluvionis TaxID=475253 RepID=A0A497XY03_9SPHI|nr:site-specific integrase [Pedobacter alluvionis]RLJ75080.1 phage integrase family protein [Pedobacter alluvionis]TFB30190.1 site-specific integrase [Pedobacter alluvionis]